MLLDTTPRRGLDTEPRDHYQGLGRSFPNMDRVAPAADSRDYDNSVQGPSVQGAPYHQDGAGYQRQPQPYGSPHAGNTGSSSSSSSNSSSISNSNSNQNGRHEESMNPAESRPASFDSDNRHSSKKPRLDRDNNGQHRPQYDGSYASHHLSPPGPSSAGPSPSSHAYGSSGDYGSSSDALPRQSAQRPLAPRPPKYTSLPRFSVSIMDPLPSSYSSPALPPQQAPPYPPSSSSSYPSRSEMQNPSSPSPPLRSPLNGSPFSRRESTISGGVPAVPSPSSSHNSARDDGRAKQYSVHGQNQGAHHFGSAPPPHGPPPLRGAEPMPQQPRPHPTDGHARERERERERQYPYHDVPYSGGPRRFRFSQPYNTLSQQLTPTLPLDFEEREAYCDSRGVIVRSAPNPSDHQHHQHHQHRQHYEHHQYQDPTVQYEQQWSEKRHQQYQHHPHHEHHEHHEHPDGQAPHKQYAHQHGLEHAELLKDEVDEEGITGWEPEVKPKELQPEKANGDLAEEGSIPAPKNEQAPGSAQSSPPAPPRSASLRDILHPVDQTPLLRSAEISVRPANEAHAVPMVIPPPVEEAGNWNPYSESGSSASASGSPKDKAERRQRSTFTQEQRDETSQTRTYGACLRCKSQRVRCVPSPLGPYDMCMTCEQVSRNSKKVLHRIRCVRWRLTSMTTYRSGGLDLTKRWAGTEVHNVGDWVSDDIKEIDMKLYYSSHMHRYDLCDTPVKLRIREFAPLPDDVLTRKWSKRVVDEDGTPKIEKKVATLPAFALADVEEAEKALDSYFKTNMINAMLDATRHCVPIIREHYHAAIRHYQSFPEGDFEKTFLEKFFRLWFYTRFTTGSSYISGGDKLGCKPITDPDYPLGNRISVPRMITAQCDSIMVTKFLKPLSHGLILELEKIFRTGNPDNWFTLYICTFMLLGEVSFSSQDRRRHGTDNWITDTPYSLYEFVSDLQFGGNILLCYWHYYRTMDPMDAGWDIFCQVIEPPLKARERIESAKGKGKKKVHVTLDQRQLVMAHWPKMVELANILSTVHHNKSFEHPLYFVSQMYMREWDIREVYSYTPPGCNNNTKLNRTTRR